MQKKVREVFSDLRLADERTGAVPWCTISAAREKAEIGRDILSLSLKIIDEVKGGKRMKKLWDGEEYVVSRANS